MRLIIAVALAASLVGCATPQREATRSPQRIDPQVEAYEAAVVRYQKLAPEQRAELANKQAREIYEEINHRKVSDVEWKTRTEIAQKQAEVAKEDQARAAETAQFVRQADAQCRYETEANMANFRGGILMDIANHSNLYNLCMQARGMR
jgi:hypothetical protein